MMDYRTAAARLRAAADCARAAPLAAEVVLPRLYPVASVLLPSLSVSRLRDWLSRHGADVPPTLTTCRERRLRGAVVAWRGFGLLCADAEDGDLERRFTFAHEAAHFLQHHFYPRDDLLERFGPSIRPVLDGRRAPTVEERVDALLGRSSLTLHTHLLERDQGAGCGWIDSAEADADLFACEILAPQAALEARFPRFLADEEAVAQVRSVLSREFGLPPAPAGAYARRFVATFGEPVTVLHRLRFS
jgi:hypothetical protein